jgi:hypothetical protein
MKLCPTLFSFYFISLFSSCTPCSTKTIACDAFNEPVFYKWFPYHVGDQLKFKNNTGNDSCSYVIASLNTSGAYDAQRGGFSNGLHACYASASITNQNSGVQDDIFHIQYSITTEFDNGPISKYLELYFKSNTWAVGEITIAVNLVHN